MTEMDSCRCIESANGGGGENVFFSESQLQMYIIYKCGHSLASLVDLIPCMCDAWTSKVSVEQGFGPGDNQELP